MTAADRLVATARRAGPALRRIGLDAGLASTPARLLRRRLFRIDLSELHRILDALEEVGIDAWLAGGWGVDALVERETRPHSDVDMCLRVADAERASGALRSIGYRCTATREAGGPSFPVRAVYRDERGRTIDVLLVRGTDDPDIDTLTGLELPQLDDRDVTVGRLGGRAVGCLSVGKQIDSHLGYAPSRRDRLDLEVLEAAFDAELPAEFDDDRPMGPISRLRGRVARFRTTSALYVRVPAAQALFEELRVTDIGLPPHVTVLYPFLPPRRIGDDELSALEAIFAAAPTLTLTLDRVAESTFDGGSSSDSTFYLSLADPSPFVTLIEAVVARWPEHPPYRGQHAVEPHLTVPSPAVDLDRVSRIVDRILPLEEQVTEVELAVRDPWSRWKTRARFRLGAIEADDRHR